MANPRHKYPSPVLVDLTREELEAAYIEECGQYNHVLRMYNAEKERKADATLLARIAELEAALATVNARLALAQQQKPLGGGPE